MDRGTTWIRPAWRIAGRDVSLFHICGVSGLFVGTGLGVWLAMRTGLSPLLVMGLLGVAIVVFAVLALATKVVLGREALIYYHHEVAVLVSVGAVLRAIDAPVLPYLDVTILGIGAFLAFGRCGCLMVGCCHGRPHGWGVRYSAAHAREGFPTCFVGVSLLPVQVFEAAIVACIVAAGAAAVASSQPAGTALSGYVVLYGLARIWLEELRGDRTRPYWLGISEAQWTSALLGTLAIGAAWRGHLPLTPAHAWVSAAIALSLVTLAATRTDAHRLLHPRHASEIAEILHASPSTGAVQVQRTSLTVGVSAGELRGVARPAVHVSLSRADRALTTREARALAGLVTHLLGAAGKEGALFCGARDVFHLVLPKPGAS